MSTLAEKITAAEVHDKVVADCINLIETEVSSKRGLSGAAVKAGYKVVKAIKPGIIREAIVKLLPEFAGALQPMYDDSGAADAGDRAGEVFSTHLSDNQESAADALLSVTDRRAEGANNKTLKKTYEKLRGSAKEHVRAAVPNLAKTLGKYV